MMPNCAQRETGHDRRDFDRKIGRHLLREYYRSGSHLHGH